MSSQKPNLSPVKSTTSTMRSPRSEVELKIADSIHSNSFPAVNGIQRSHLRALFDKFDDNHAGTLSLSKFSSLCGCILEPSHLDALDIDTIFNTIDVDASQTIDFDEFIGFIQPSLQHSITNRGDHRVNFAFATTVMNHTQTETSPSHNNNNANTNSKPAAQTHFRKYSSPSPPDPKTFSTEYEARFWSRDMGVELVAGERGTNAYMKWRFTEHARTNISSGSQIIAINGKNMDGVVFEAVVHFLHIVIVTEEGFLVRFRPVCLLHDDDHRPTHSDVHLIHDNLTDNELLKPKFEKKRQRRKRLRKLMTMSGHGALPTTEPSMDYSATDTHASATKERELSMTVYGSHSNMFDENSLETMLEHIDNCQPPRCWQRCPLLVRRVLRVRTVDTISQLKQYHTHCRHCPKKAQPCRSTMHMLLDNEKYNRLSYFIQVTIMLTIIISTLAYVLQTLPEFRNDPVATAVFNGIEFTVSMIFTIEYVLRIIAARNICVFFWDGLNLIDFIAIIPFWIEVISGAEGSNALRVIRVIRLARVFRLMKSPRFAEYMQILQASITASAASFAMLLTLIFLEIIVASSLVYVCEANLDLPDNQFTSIPATTWWAFTTVTTVGYGDMVPQSAVGRLICTVTLFSGLLVIALPVIIIGGNFEQQYSRYLSRKKRWSAAHVFGVNEDNGKQIKTVARLLHFVNHSLSKDIFEWNDVRALYESGLDSFEIINRVLKLDHGYVYLPLGFSSYKKYALFHHYGGVLRQRNQAHYLHQPAPNPRQRGASKPFLLYGRQTQSQPPPTVKSLQHVAENAQLQQEKHELNGAGALRVDSNNGAHAGSSASVLHAHVEEDDVRSVTAYEDDDEDEKIEQLIIKTPNPKKDDNNGADVNPKRNTPTTYLMAVASASASMSSQSLSVGDADTNHDHTKSENHQHVQP